MSGNLNKVMLIGNVSRDPQFFEGRGNPILAFGLATTESWRTPTGEKKSKTEFHNIKVFGKQAPVLQKFLVKGKQVMVEGRIQYDKYTNKEGVEVPTTIIRCDNLVLLGGKEDGSAKPKAAAPTASDDGGDDYGFDF